MENQADAKQKLSEVALCAKLATGEMNIKIHIINNKKIAEIISDEVLIRTTQNALDLLGHLYYEDVDKTAIYERNIIPEFFDLKTGIAGDILQKFTQYQMPIIIIGDFSKFKSKSLQDFIFESNNGRQVNFVSSLLEVIESSKR